MPDYLVSQHDGLSWERLTQRPVTATSAATAVTAALAEAERELLTDAFYRVQGVANATLTHFRGDVEVTVVPE